MKNPWMSAWLSMANKVASTVRGQAMAEATRNRKAAVDAMLGAAKPKKPTRKRRRK